MSDVLIILCTFPNPEQARQIGTALVERQLAACVNLLPAVESIYRWQDKLETNTETLAIFKTSEAVFPLFEEILEEMHPYETPEIIALPAAKVAPSYETWLLANVALPDR